VGAPTPEAVKAFVNEIEHAEVKEERATPGENVNAYKETKAGYGSTAAFKGSPAGTAKAATKKRAISSDFTAK
jgi:hypothetical protein